VLGERAGREHVGGDRLQPGESLQQPGDPRRPAGAAAVPAELSYEDWLDETPVRESL
jgi:hypothetical protein